MPFAVVDASYPGHVSFRQQRVADEQPRLRNESTIGWPMSAKSDTPYSYGHS